MDPRIAQFRIEIRDIDLELQRLVRHRLELARRIGEAKQHLGLPVRDYAAEQDVIERWRSGLSLAEVSEERSDELTRWLMEESVRVEEASGESNLPKAASTDVLVVGGAGRMGRWLAEFLRSSGHRVGVFDPRAEPDAPGISVRTDLARAAQDAAVVVVATPMRAAPPVYKELWSSETEAVVFDVLSIKAPLLPWIHRGVREGFHVGSAHPLFGPSTRTLSGRNLLVLDCGDPVANQRIVELFRRSALKITTLPIESHDTLMAEVLALPHAVSLVFALASVGSKLSDHRRTEIAPVSFQRQLEVSRIVANENPDLSFDIQALNPSSEAMYQRLEAAVKSLREAAVLGNESRYRSLVETARSLLENGDAHRHLASDGPRVNGLGGTAKSSPRPHPKEATPRTRT